MEIGEGGNKPVGKERGKSVCVCGGGERVLLHIPCGDSGEARRGEGRLSVKIYVCDL